MPKTIEYNRTGGLVTVKVDAEPTESFSIYSHFRFKPTSVNTGFIMYVEGKAAVQMLAGDTVKNGAATLAGNADAKILLLAPLFVPGV